VTSFFLKTTDFETHCRPGSQGWNASWHLPAVFHFWAFLGGTPFFMGASPVDFLSPPRGFLCPFQPGRKGQDRGPFSALVDSPPGWKIGREQTSVENHGLARVEWVSGDLVSSVISPFLTSPGGRTFFVRRKRFDPDCGNHGFLCRFCYRRKVRERWVFHVPWRKVLTCRVIGRKLLGHSTLINFSGRTPQTKGTFRLIDIAVW
jgi:hypothetical protein